MVTAPAAIDSAAAPNIAVDSSATVSNDVNPAVGGSLGNGQNQSTTIASAGQVDSWTFSGTQGNAVTITMAKLSGTADFTPWIRVLAPNGALLANMSNASVARADISLPQTGTYTVQAASFDTGNDGTGMYRIRMAKAPGAFVVPAGDHGGPLTNGANHTGVIAAGDLDIWSFSGTTGEAVTLTMAEVTGAADFTPWIRLIAPNGAVVANISNASVSRVDLNLTQTGTYTAVVSSFDPGNDATGDYRLILAKAPGTFTVPAGDEGGALSNGANHTGVIAAGDLDMWSFAGTNGDAVTLTMAEVTGAPDFTPWIRLIAPNGVVAANISNGSASRVDLNLTQTGTYTVVVSSFDAGNDATGDYRLILAQAPGIFTVPAGDEGGALSNGANHTGVIAAGDLDMWSFAGTNGDAVTLTMAEVTGVADFTPWIRLIAPNGAVLVNISNGSASRADLNLTQTGTYTVVVSSFDAGNDATGDYRLILAQAPGSFTVSEFDEGGAVTNGENHTGTIVSGDLDMWSFSATQGDAVTLTMAELTGVADFAPWIRVIAPNGAVLVNISGATVARDDISLPSTGVYTVIASSFDTGNDATGDYRLIVAKAPGAFTIPVGDHGGPTGNGLNKMGSIAVGDLDLWSFSANSGDAITITMAEVTGTAGFAPWLRVIAPNGTVLVNTSTAVVARADFSVTQTGTFTVVVSSFDAGFDDTGNYRLIVAKAPGAFTTSPGDQGGALNNGANKSGAIAVGDLDMYRFQSNAGDAITVTMAEVSGVAEFAPWIRLIAPNGVVLANTSNASVARLDLSATVTGTYTLVVSSFDANNDATGNYRLILAKAPGTFVVPTGDHGGALTNGVTRTGAIAKGDLDMWSFNAVQGTTFTVTMTETSGLADFAPWVRVIAPNGTVIASFAHVSSVVLNLSAPVTGTYTLVLSSFDTGNDATGQYTVNVSGAGISSGSAPVVAGDPED